MDVALSEEQLSLAGAAARLLGDLGKADRVADDFDGAGSQSWWDQLARTGWLAIGVGEEYGGAEGDLLDLGVLFREFGRVVAPSRLRSAVAGRIAVDRLGTETQRKDLLPALCSQEQSVTVAFAEPGVELDPASLTTRAVPSPDGWTLTGHKRFVPDLQVSDRVVVAARVERSDQVAFFLLDPTAPGVVVSPQRMFSGDPYFELRLEDVAVAASERLGEHSGQDTLDRWDLVTSEMNALIAMEAIGGTEAILDIASTYVQQRTQFGVPIGGFQAVQHHLANVAISLGGARLVAWKGVTEGPEGWARSAAKAISCRNFKDGTLTCHQVLGGIGITHEFALLKYSARAKLLEAVGGVWEYHLERVARGVGL